jgi:two-component system sensor histidine kinase FlrB
MPFSNLSQSDSPEASADTLLDALPAAVILLDAHGAVRSANGAAREWLGEPLTGQLWRDVCARDFRASRDGNDLQAADGRFVNISTRPLSGEPGQVVLLADVTEARAAQRQVERNLRLAGMGEMLARLSHQIRTPLSTAILYASQLNEPVLPEQGRRKAGEKVLARLQHMEQMVRDMLMFAHGAQFRLETVELITLLEEVRQQLDAHLERRGARLDIDCASGLQVGGNRVGLTAALLNLCMNALENSGDGTWLRIGVEACGKRLQICVDDNGPGIPAELREKILQPFFTTRSDGTGLGLPVVRSVVESHGGSLSIAGSPLGGARFLLDLPALDADSSELLPHARCA